MHFDCFRVEHVGGRLSWKALESRRDVPLLVFLDSVLSVKVSADGVILTYVFERLCLLLLISLGKSIW